MSDAMTSNNNIELAAEIVSAYVSNNSVPAADLPSLINEVYGALVRVGTGLGVVSAPVEAPKPAVAVKKSVTNDFIICLEDGKKFKSLKRHLRYSIRSLARRIPRKMGTCGRLSDGRPQLRQGPLEPRQANGAGTATSSPRIKIRRTYLCGFFSRSKAACLKWSFREDLMLAVAEQQQRGDKNGISYSAPNEGLRHQPVCETYCRDTRD